MNTFQTGCLGPSSRVELGPKGIRVSNLAPGIIETGLSNVLKSERGRSFAIGFQALKRLGQRRILPT